MVTEFCYATEQEKGDPPSVDSVLVSSWNISLYHPVGLCSKQHRGDGYKEITKLYYSQSAYFSFYDGASF